MTRPRSIVTRAAASVTAMGSPPSLQPLKRFNRPLRTGVVNSDRRTLECPCPPAGAIDIVGKKWAICVVTLLGRHGLLRFGPIQRSLPGVSPATLTSTLRALEREALVRRVRGTADGRSPHSYELTASGSELYRSLRPLASWLRRT